MGIFISYPHELKDKANVIYSELSNIEKDIFIDRNMDKTDEWRREIREALRKHEIFILLYNLDREKSDDPSRFITVELTFIERELDRNKEKKCITILFPPATTIMLPAFLRKYNNIPVRENDNLDYEWTSSVIETVEKIKKQKILEVELTKETERKEAESKQIFKRIRLLAYASIILFITISLLFLIFRLLFPPIPIQPPKTQLSPLIDQQPKLCKDAASVKNATFTMKSEYDYIDDEYNGIKFKGRSVTGFFTEPQCKEVEGLYRLEGNERTEQRFQASLDGGKTFEDYGTSTNETTSTISFNKDGEPYDRSISHIKNIDSTCINQKCEADKELKNKIENSYSALVKKKHDLALSSGQKCKPLIDRADTNITREVIITSICGSYTRVMRGEL
jgi:hypothetical protein